MDFALCNIRYFFREHQDTFSITERTAIMKLLKDMKMLLIKSLPEFSVGLKVIKWEGLQLFTFLQMHVCIVCI